MKTSRWIVILLMLAFSDACVEPLDVPVITSGRKLVVDGLITDAAGPHKVKLFMSSYLNEDLNSPVDVTGALVRIVDDLGNEVILNEEIDGEYTSDAGFQGEVGRKYRLEIELENGKEYQSTFEELQPPGELTNLYFEYRENSINQNDLTKPQDAFWVYLDATGVPQEKNLLRWRWTGTFQYRTYPESREKNVGDVVLPDPIPCSGYIAPDGALIQVGPCICCDCWAPFYNRDVLISNNDFASAEHFNGVLIGKIPVDKIYFYDRFHVGVEQLALSEEAYDFWKLLGASKHGAENIFQPNTISIKGNISCVTDNSEEVYGIFSAASVVEKGIFISQADIPGGVADLDSVIADCRQTYPGATNQKPPFW